MEEKAVSLLEMLKARECRVQRQRELLEQYHCPLVCFTMNIAGPIKQSVLIQWGFDEGRKLFQGRLRNADFPCIYSEVRHEATGNTAFYMVHGDASALKSLTVEIEDESPIGRLFDMDILDENGEHIDREKMGLPERKCLLCDQSAKVCARSRSHSLETLQAYTNALLQEEFMRQNCREIARLACQSLLYEVCTTPKPGLVDRLNSGSHQDMDCFTFMSSVSALWPYFEQCARIGIETADETPPKTFARLRWTGKEAEIAMLSATGGVNTHKGAIFSVGILCGALGRLPMEQWRNPDAILKECAGMTKGLAEQEFRDITVKNAKTAGQRLYAEYGITGIRGEVEQGFPSVRKVGLPTLEKGLACGIPFNRAGCGTLLALLVSAVDTNMIARSDWNTRNQMAKEIAQIIETDPFPNDKILERLDLAFMERNLSPGGSADLLAVTYFLYFLKSRQDV